VGSSTPVGQAHFVRVNVHGYSKLADPFAEVGVALLINVIALQKFNCLSF